MEQTIQKKISQVLNKMFPEPWGAFGATALDGTEYVELINEETQDRYIITIQKGWA